MQIVLTVELREVLYRCGLVSRDRAMTQADISIFEPELSTSSMIEQHPLAWIIEVDGFLVDARALPAEIRDDARRLGLIPDLAALRAA